MIHSADTASALVVRLRRALVGANVALSRAPAKRAAAMGLRLWAGVLARSSADQGTSLAAPASDDFHTTREWHL